MTRSVCVLVIHSRYKLRFRNPIYMETSNAAVIISLGDLQILVIKFTNPFQKLIFKTQQFYPKRMSCKTTWNRYLCDFLEERYN